MYSIRFCGRSSHATGHRRVTRACHRHVSPPHTHWTGRIEYKTACRELRHGYQQPLSPEMGQWIHAFVDSTYVGRLWTHQNFNPNTKADLDWVKSVLNGKADTAYVNNRLNDKADGAWVNDMLRGKANAGAECQHDSNIWDYGVMKGDSTSKVQDLPNPWVVTGLSAVWLTEDRLHGIGMRARKIRNQ